MILTEALVLLFSGICQMWQHCLPAAGPSSALSIGHFSSDYYVLNMHASLINSTGDELVVVSAVMTNESHGLEMRGYVSLGDGRIAADFLPLPFGASVESAAIEQFVESLGRCLVEASQHPNLVNALAG